MRHAVVPGRCIQTQGWFVGIRRQRYLRRKKSVQGWPQEEREFYSAAASSACALPACDGVSASVLESLALGVPVVASENGRRPAGVVTLFRNECCGHGGEVSLRYEILLRGQVRAPPGDPGRQHGQDGGLAAAESSGSGLMNRACQL